MSPVKPSEDVKERWSSLSQDDRDMLMLEYAFQTWLHVRAIRWGFAALIVGALIIVIVLRMFI